MLELCSTSAVPDGAALNAAVRAHLDGSEPHGETDARLSRAVRRVAGKADLSVIARVAATGKVSLARLIARGEKIEDDGRAHLGDEEAVAPPKASRLPRVLRRRG